MQTKIESILRGVNQPNRRLNILTFVTHERNSSLLKHSPHNFFLMQVEGTKPWINRYAPLPDNFVLFEKNQPLPPWLKIDLVIQQNKSCQYKTAKQISEHLNIPIISLEHCLPAGMTPKQIEYSKQFRGHKNLFITEMSMKAWGFSFDDPTVDVIGHAIDSELFKPTDFDKEPDGKIMTVANDYINRNHLLGFDIYRQLTEGLPTNPVGDTPGLSKSANNINDLVSKLQRCSLYLNTSQISPLPMSLLEAASVGSLIISTEKCAVGEYFKDQVHGFISNDLKYLREIIETCLNDRNFYWTSRHRMGFAARKMIQEKFGVSQHIDKWQSIFNELEGRGNF